MSNIKGKEESLPEIISSFAPYDVMNQKDGDLEGKNGLRVKGLVENQLCQQ